MMFIKPGDIIQMKNDVFYAVTKPGTRWLVYDVKTSSVLVGTMPINDYSPADMIRLYGQQHDSVHIKRRFEAGVKLYLVSKNEVELIGNNALFKHKLLQGDMWKEKPKQQTWSRGNGNPAKGVDWDTIFREMGI
jgi:signal peptidase I